VSPTHQDLSNDTTFSQIKSRVPVPLSMVCQSIKIKFIKGTVGTLHWKLSAFIGHLPLKVLASSQVYCCGVLRTWKVACSETETENFKCNILSVPLMNLILLGLRKILNERAFEQDIATQGVSFRETDPSKVVYRYINTLNYILHYIFSGTWLITPTEFDAFNEFVETRIREKSWDRRASCTRLSTTRDRWIYNRHDI